MRSERHFWKGLLAHLLIVTPWVASPAALFVGIVAAGLPHGVGGVLVCLSLGAVLATGPSASSRAFLCAAIVAVAASGRGSHTIPVLGAATVSVLCALVTVGDGWWPQMPWLFNFVSRWAPHYYREADLRGALKEIKAGERNFFAWHPHGCLCAGFTINGTYNPEFMKHAGRTLWLCDESLRRRNPGFRACAEMYEAENHVIESGTKEDFKKFMSSGETICFMPGGFMDAAAFERGKNVVVLRSKKGFIKYCLQFGYRVTPVYTFGECYSYYTFTGLKKPRMALAKNNVPSVAFFGCPLLPFMPLTDTRLITYVGRGVEMPRIPEPSPEEVDKWHGAYVEALQRVFEENKAEAGYPDAQLQIL